MAVLSAACMTVGLLRWPSLHGHLALANVDATPAARDTIAAVFDTANRLLGTLVGEFLGEPFLNAFFVCATLALDRVAAPHGRWLLAVGSAASLLGALAMLRNLTPWVETLAAANKVVLPVWTTVLRVVLLRQTR